MLFEKKDDKPEKIRIKDSEFWAGWKWVTLRKGSQIDLPKEYGLRLGLEPVPVKKRSKPKKAGDNSKKEAGGGQEDKKQDPKLDAMSKKKQVLIYKEKIESIKGVGQKTAKDIIQVYPTEGYLMKALKSGKEIPIRDDLAKLIKRKFKVK